MAEPVSSVVARNVARLLEQRGMSGRALARSTGLPHANITRKLAGLTPFTLDELAPVARALSVDVRSLLRGTR